MSGWSEHSDREVQQAIIKLCDALCTWERCTGRDSILILREAGGFCFRADSGKPITRSNDDITDQQLMEGLAIRAARA